jgi:hypothetical protein
MNKTPKQIENCITSELSNLIGEFESGTLDKEGILSYVSTILLDANLDSRIVVNILEQPDFGEEGQYQARCIKVNEGW